MKKFLRKSGIGSLARPVLSISSSATTCFCVCIGFGIAFLLFTLICHHLLFYYWILRSLLFCIQCTHLAFLWLDLLISHQVKSFFQVKIFFRPTLPSKMAPICVPKVFTAVGLPPSYMLMLRVPGREYFTVNKYFYCSRFAALIHAHVARACMRVRENVRILFL